MSDTLLAQMLKLGLVSPEAAQRTDAPRSGNRGGAPDGGQRAGGQRGGGQRGGGQRADAERGGGARGGAPAREARGDATESSEPIDRDVALAVLASATRLPPGEGPRRFYYEARDGRVPCLSLSEEAHRALSEGAMAVVETEAGVPRLLPSEAAARLHAAWPALVRAWRR